MSNGFDLCQAGSAIYNSNIVSGGRNARRWAGLIEANCKIDQVITGVLFEF
jgi:hypothetical protein